MTKVFLDAGHGGKDPGGTSDGLKEKDIALSVTLKTGSILKRHGIELAYSRTRDEFIELRQRANKANNFNANIFVSIHTNAYTDSSSRGVEVYSYPKSKKGLNLSKDIYESIISEEVYNNKRGVKLADFAVLRHSKMPSVLVELGFITNSKDAELLRNKQRELAIALAKGILKNLKINYIENHQNNIYRFQDWEVNLMMQ